MGGGGQLTSWSLKLFEFLGDSILVSPTGVQLVWYVSGRGRVYSVEGERKRGWGAQGGVFLWLSFSLRELFCPQSHCFCA